MRISTAIEIPDSKIVMTAIRAQGAGDQNVNKVSSAIHLRFDINASSLPDEYKQRLLKMADRRITNEGVIILKAQRYRTQEQNRIDALTRLQTIIIKAGFSPIKRKPTKPTKSSEKKRIECKTKRGALKTLRGKIVEA